ncbi:hypothetical protein HYPSUDRAFT_82534 [Hypholoma sublateritium FD-334 SS-4]|uniref:Uncharacterized protein n=1 Tax=Hypholoma sublateritium (strain FD-334 SS-4) TaxID=945553 RepID=A0A0D2MXZ9_HYPSF|nr:hypothetical protein HYPSUDRAFT_82534 [Hypholoma sublateritium FD-334 SS-4]
MKEVVRKKLGVSTATPVYLTQLRDGRTVDLEDDDDFEAFSSSAYHDLTAKVKITLGIESSAPLESGNQVLQSEQIEGSPKKKKKKDRKEKPNGAFETSKTPETVTPQDIPSDAPPPSKKRRVSFIQPAKEARNVTKSAVAGDSLPTSPEPESTSEQEPTLLGNRSTQVEETSDAELTTDERRKKKKKTKKEKKDLGKQNEISADSPSKEGIPIESGTQKKTKKKKAAANSELGAMSTPVEKPAKGKPTAVGNSAAPNVDIDGTPQTKKSKKRPRTADGNGADEPIAGKNATPKASTEPEAETAASEAREKSTKKQKKVHKTNDDADGAAVINGTKPVDLAAVATSDGVPVPKTPKKARRKSDAQPVVPASTKKQANAASGTTGSVAPPEIISKSKTSKVSELRAPETNTSEKPAVEAKTPKKTTKKKNGLSEHPESTEQEKEILKAAMMQALKNRKLAAASKTSSENSALAETPAPGGTKELSTPAVGVAPVPPTASPGPQATSSAKPAATPISASAQEKPPPVIDPILLQMSTTDSSNAPLSRTGKVATIASSKATPALKATKVDANARCPVCEDEPGHARPKCPIVKKGIKAMQKRIAELEEEGTSEDDDEGRAELIAELHTLIEGKRRKPRASLAKDSSTPLETNEPAAAASAVKSVVDASIPSTAVNVVPPPAAQPPNDAAPTPMQPSAPLVSSAQSVPSIQPASSILPAPPTQSSIPIPTLPPASQLPPPTQLRPSTQPISSTQPPSFTQSKPTQNELPKSKAPKTSAASLFPSPADLSFGGGSEIFSLGDIASYTDRDIEALMRGPKLRSRDVPSDEGESADEDDDEPIALEEEEEEDERASRRGPRKSNQREYPSSSDEDENDEDDETSPQPTESSAPVEENADGASPAPSADGSDVLILQRSFHEMDATNTSRSSIDHTGDAAIDADLDMRDATPPPPPPAQPQPPANLVAVDGESSTAVDGHEEEEEKEEATAAPAASATLAPVPATLPEEGPDPIETIEEPTPSQPEPIASDNESPAPKESTPKETVLRARSQRNKQTSSQATTEELGNGGEEAASKPAGRKTRSLTKISELPIPPNPSVRMIRQASAAPPPVTPRSMRLRARAESKTVEPEQAEELAGSKAVAKIPARAGKTPVKPAAKVAAKPALPAKAPSKPAAKAAAVPKVVTTYARSTRASRLAADLESSEERDDDVGDGAAHAADPEASVAAWAVLPENSESQTALSQLGSEPNTMLDELISSPDVPTKIGASQPAKAQDPLFLASQSSFPSSQYPPRTLPSPENSDDEEEVVSVVRSGRPRQSSNYRSLTEITSQPTIFAPRYSSQMANNRTREPLDMFGTTSGNDEEESQESESETEPESKPQPSHIPATRRAGAAVPRRK